MVVVAVVVPVLAAPVVAAVDIFEQSISVKPLSSRNIVKDRGFLIFSRLFSSCFFF